MIVGHPSYLLVEHTKGKATLNERRFSKQERLSNVHKGKSRPQICGVNLNS